MTARKNASNRPHGSLAHSPLFGMVIIALLGLLVYGQTLHVLWYFDDLPNIVENPVIRDLTLATRSLLTSGRGLAQWSFALNYRFAGLEVTGYHLVNIAIHLVTAGFVQAILRRLFPPASWLPLLGALLFLVHPLQTQAVTYIVQRMTSLSGLCFFLALYLYIRGRETLVATGNCFSRRHVLYYLASLFAGAAAVLIKQNAAILPLALLLFDAYFLSKEGVGNWQKRLLYVLPFFVVPLWLTVVQLLLPLAQGTGFAELTGAGSLVNQQQISSLHYLATEFSVIWLYLRLLVLPYGQALDYGYPVVESLLTGKTILALLGIIVVLWGACACRKRMPLVSFGIFWFFLALSVESSLIPLDPVFEHRLYVPLFGFVLVVLGLLQRLPQHRWGEVILLLLLPLLAVTAWQRNALWNDPIAFYESNLRWAPWSERVRVALSKEYLDAGRYDEALALLERALQINPNYVDAYQNLSFLYIERSQYDRAMEILLRGLRIDPFSARLNDNIGTLYEKIGQSGLAITHLQRAIALDPSFAKAYLSLGAVYAENGQPQQAIENYRKAIALTDRNVDAHFNLGVIFYRQKRLREAQQEFLLATEQAPGDAEALANLARISLELGERQTALDILPRLGQMNAKLADQLQQQLALPH
jgi:protein O-mannosyl-transferase